MERRIGLLFDCIRSPYDIAHIMQLGAAIDICDLYASGNSIDLANPKILSKVRSWRIQNIPRFQYFENFEEAIDLLRSIGKRLIGTVPHAPKSIYDLNLSEGNSVFVFGNESSGLTLRKQQCLDEIVSVPTTADVSFLTLPTVVPIIAYETYRQIKNGHP
jgi:tRNA G18 (ribose-2'-O)-methylase SpoU